MKKDTIECSLKDLVEIKRQCESLRVCSGEEWTYSNHQTEVIYNLVDSILNYECASEQLEQPVAQSEYDRYHKLQKPLEYWVKELKKEGFSVSEKEYHTPHGTDTIWRIEGLSGYELHEYDTLKSLLKNFYFLKYKKYLVEGDKDLFELMDKSKFDSQLKIHQDSIKHFLYSKNENLFTPDFNPLKYSTSNLESYDLEYLNKWLHNIIDNYEIATLRNWLYKIDYHLRNRNKHI